MTQENGESKNTSLSIPNKITTKKIGLAARVQENKINAASLPNRIVLVIDDSGSMLGEAIANAKKGVENFLQRCDKSTTAIALYPLNTKHYPLSNDFVTLNVLKESIQADGGTPLYEKLIEGLTENPTRAVCFSDGQPSPYERDECIRQYLEKKIPVDTIFIGASPSGEDTMRYLAEKTGGIYLHFTDSLALCNSLKYLTPGLRGLLANAELKEKNEKGEAL